MPRILETVVYKPKPGIDPGEALKKIEAVMDPLLHRLGGIERLWRSRQADGTLIDNLIWQDEESFRRRAAMVAEHGAELGPVFGLFDETTFFRTQARIFE